MKAQTSDNTSGLFLELMFIATDNIDLKIFLDDDLLFATYLANDIGIESSHIDNQDSLALLLNFIFNTDVTLIELAGSANRKVYDLTSYKDTCIPIDDLERNYPAWIKESSRENTMDEYGNLVSIIGYIKRNHVKKHLVLTVEKRKKKLMNKLFDNYKTLLEQRLDHKPLLFIGEDSIRYDFFAALMSTYDLKPYQIELEVPLHKKCFVANQNENSRRKEKPMIDLVVKNEHINLSIEFGLFRQNSNEKGTINQTYRTVKMVNDILRTALQAKYSESKGLFICVADNKIIGHKLKSGYLGEFPSNYVICNEYLLHQSQQRTNNIDPRFFKSFATLNQKIHSEIIYNERLNAYNIKNETRVIIWENEIR